MAKSPEKFFTAAVIRVMDPKTAIIPGRTRDGPYFLPSIPKKGAVRTYGMKKTYATMLILKYCQALGGD